MNNKNGFTLAELLIALAILGVIATFTIPKVLSAQNDGKYKAIAKEAAAMVSGAYQAYRMDHEVTASMNFADLTPYMNYVKADTAGVNDIDRITGGASITCDASNPCIRLHNGAAILYTPFDDYFNGTATTNAVYFYVDPDGQYSGSATGNGKSIVFFLYFTGKITTWGTALGGTNVGGGVYGPTPANDPSWFSWN